jgi:cell division protein FtsQ
VLAVVLAGLLTGAWLWLRDSSLVAVERVTVTGDTGPDAPQIRSALVAAARTMTTLDVNPAQLRSAIAPYPIAHDVRVATDFPHGLRIQVIEQIPVAVVAAGGRTVPVAADGTLLHDAASPPPLPVLQLAAPPGGPRLTEPDALAAVHLLGAAPYQLLARITQVTRDPAHGLTAQVRGGPVIYFGDATQPAAKWLAATDVMADRGSVGAVYIDVTEPRRPAAGAGSGAGSSSGGAASGAGASSGGAGSRASALGGSGGSGGTSGTSGSGGSGVPGGSSGTSGSGGGAGVSGP